MDDAAGAGLEGWREVCDHAVIIHRTVPVASRTPLLNHWLVCLTCGTQVCLSLHVSAKERDAARREGGQ